MVRALKDSCDVLNIDEKGEVLYAAVRTGTEIQKVYLRSGKQVIVAGGFADGTYTAN